MKEPAAESGFRRHNRYITHSCDLGFVPTNSDGQKKGQSALSLG